MMYKAIKQRKSFVLARITVLLVTASFCQWAQAVPPLWEASYDILATELNGGGNSTGGGPSGTSGGTENIALGFNFPFGGNNYTRIVVDSDGSILLTNNASNVSSLPPTIWKKSAFQPNFTNFGGGSAGPVLLPFNTALNQFETGGKTYFKTFDDSFGGFPAERAVITWEQSHNGSTSGVTADVTVQAQLLDDGTIIFSYQADSPVAGWNSAPQGIVIGVSNGDGQPLTGSQDFSSGGGIDLTGYEIWCQNESAANPPNCQQAGLGKNSAFDLDDQSIVFNPDGTTGFLVSSVIEDGSGSGGSDLCVVPTEDAPAGPDLFDDDYDVLAIELDGNNGNAHTGVGPSGSLGGTENVALGFNFPFGGTNYSHILVDSDGSIQLVNNNSYVSGLPPTIWNSANFLTNFTNFGQGSPRPVILPFASGLDQFNTGGKTYFKYANGTFNGFTGDRAIITWEDSTLNNSSTKDLIFQAQLFGDGKIIFSYKVKSNLSNWDTKSSQGIVVGISNGEGEFPLGSQNFSTYDFGIDLTGYEIWCRNDDPEDPANCAQSGLGTNDEFDLDDRSIVFNPDGSGAFLVSSSIKSGAGNGGSDVCAVPPAPAPPVAVDDSISTDEDTKFNSVVQLDANDTDANGDKLVVISGTFTTAQGGKITIETNGDYSYVPLADFNGSDSVDYTVKEKNGPLSDVGTLNITVISVNDEPVARNDEIEVMLDTVFMSTTDLDANDEDVDSSLTVVAGTFDTDQLGSITIATNGSFTYTPPAGFIGSDKVNYTVTDGDLQDVGRLDIVVSSDLYDASSEVLTELNKLKKKNSIKKNKKARKAMNKAIKHVKKTRTAIVDGNISKALGEISSAIADLRKVKKNKGAIAPLMEDLADSAKDEAEVAIVEAQDAMGNGALIAEAQALMLTAEGQRLANRPDQAAKSYEAAWAKAKEAVV